VFAICSASYFLVYLARILSLHSENHILLFVFACVRRDVHWSGCTRAPGFEIYVTTSCLSYCERQLAFSSLCARVQHKYSMSARDRGRRPISVCMREHTWYALGKKPILADVHRVSCAGLSGMHAFTCCTISCFDWFVSNGMQAALPRH
jgi:hypothetical protein